LPDLPDGLFCHASSTGQPDLHDMRAPLFRTTAYRPHIDGIRAIAVLSVVIDHLSPQWLPRG
jgi:hypothetical protein